MALLAVGTWTWFHPPASGAAPQSQSEPEIPGWAVSYRSAGARGFTDGCRAVEFALAPDESPHPRVNPDGFQATYRGMLHFGEPGRYRLGAEVEGGEIALNLFVDESWWTPRLERVDQPGAPGERWLSEWLELEGESVQVQLQFRRAGKAPARLQALWAMDFEFGFGFEPEPVPTRVVMPLEEDREAVSRAQAAFEGRVWLGEYGCLNCHAARDGSEPASDRNALASAAVHTRQAPDLSDLGARVSPQWLRRWLADPQAVKPGTSMPGVFHGKPEDAQVIDELVHYLVGDALPPSDAGRVPTEAELDRGKRLYHSAGCVACHGPMAAPAEALDEESLSSVQPTGPTRVPFGDLRHKWRPEALKAFLLDPLETHPSGRMPAADLSEEEAQWLSDYLISQWRAAQPIYVRPNTAAQARGRKAFERQGCAACHTMQHGGKPLRSRLSAPSWKDLKPDRGCLATSRGQGVHFDLDPRRRRAMQIALEELSFSRFRSPMDETERHYAALRCDACHVRDGSGGPADPLKAYFITSEEVDLGDEGRLPPELSDVGRKLNRPWLREVLTNSARVRPYMATRMPQFGEEQAEALLTGMAAADGVWADRDWEATEPTDEGVQTGLEIVGSRGLGCMECHAFGDYPSTGAPNLQGFGERLRYSWWRLYAHNPVRFKPGTRMPRYFEAGKSTLTRLLEGDAEAQVDAMWMLFNLGEFMPTPDGVPDPQAHQLSVGPAPRVFRTFLKAAGSRGIAVGYPQGVHFAFDATGVRLVDAWQGDFVSAASAWTGRGGSIAGGQGGGLWSAPPGPPLVLGSRPETWPSETGAEAGYAFKGYRFDDRRQPRFHYQVSELGTGMERAPSISVTEHFRPAEEADFRVQRRFEVEGLAVGQGLWLNVGANSSARVSAESNASVQAAAAPEGESWWEIRCRQAGQAVQFLVEVQP